MATTFTDSETSGEENLIPEVHSLVHAHQIIKKREVFDRLKQRVALHDAFYGLSNNVRKSKAKAKIVAFLSKHAKRWQTRRKLHLFDKYTERLYGVCGDSIESFLVAIQILHAFLDIPEHMIQPSLLRTINSVVQTPVRENFQRGMKEVENNIDLSVLLHILCPNQSARIVLWPLLSEYKT